MARLTQILTHKFTPEEIRQGSEEVAQKSGEDWVTVDSINQYNAAHVPEQLNTFKKIVRFFVLHPRLWHTICTLTLPILFLPLVLNPMLTDTGIVSAILGAFIGFVIGSFIYPALPSSCKICGAIKKCEQIYTYCLHAEEHTEKRWSNHVQYKYLVRKECVFCIYECKKCKSRKIEILIVEKEKQL